MSGNTLKNIHSLFYLIATPMSWHESVLFESPILNHYALLIILSTNPRVWAVMRTNKHGYLEALGNIWNRKVSPIALKRSYSLR